MKKHLPIFLVFLTIVLVAAASVAADAPAAQAPDGEEGPVAPAGPETPAAPENLFTVVTIEPSISLPDNDPSLACFDMVVNLDAAATVVDVGVTVQHTHTKAGDLIYQLHNPDGEYLTMLNRPGFNGVTPGDTSNLSASAPITFSNSATDNAENMGNSLDTDGVICQDDGRCHYFPNPGEDATSLHSFANMVGGTANGTWQFCASDNEAGDSGLLEEVQMTVVYVLPQVTACTTSAWQPIADLNTARSRTGVAYSETTGKFYAVGGEATGGDRDIAIEEYDAASNTWTDKSHLLTGVSNTGVVAVEPYIFVPGGYDGLNGLAAMQRYDPVADEVTTVAPMPAANHAHATTALDGKIYVTGGAITGTVGTTNYIYDVASNTWDSGAPLPTAVQYPAAATDGTYIYVLGGNTTNLATVQRYDPVGDSWDTIPDMGTGRGGPAAFFDGANVWVVNGGWGQYLASVEYWDGVEWQTGPPTNGRARTLGTAFGGGLAIKAGGWDGTYLAAAEALEIDCATPDIEVDDTELMATVSTGQMVTHTVTISNSGGAELVWSTTEAPALRPWGDVLSVRGEGGEEPVEEERGRALASGMAEGVPSPEEVEDGVLDFPTGPAGGGLTYYAERAAFEDDNPGLPVEDFEEGNVLPGGTTTCVAPVHESSVNDCFGAGDIVPGILFQNNVVSSLPGLALAGDGFMENPSTSLFVNFAEEWMEIYFTAPDVYAVGMDLHSQYVTSGFEVTIYGWDGVTVLGTTAAAGTPAGIFWGVMSEQPIGRMTLHSATDQFEGLDNIAFGYSGICATPQEIPWASVSPESGTVAAGGVQALTVAFDSSGLDAGETVSGTLCVNSNDPDEPHTLVSLWMTVEGYEVYLPAILKP